MASVAIRCGGNHLPNRRLSDIPRYRNALVGPPCSIAMSNNFHISGRKPPSISMSVNTGIANTTDSTHNNGKAVVYEKLDEWMKDSVVEIVKNLREAPLLVHVYADHNGQTTTLKTEKAVEENWPIVTEKWETRETPLPDGVIFVEQLDDNKEDDDVMEEEEEEEDITTAWGIVVQGKGVDCGPVCYLLKTSRVGSGSGLGLGMGLCCTHFCLMQVISFRESARSQLKNCWLLQAQSKSLDSFN